ncbi:UNVERIFIED_CONTAM: 5-methylthioadenosine/S-adenosylhomocysteine deaminase [Sesamum latifolium]|uniref:5-methylthioadenosine/S-adenosylhomocysteine deaminase n=1 Tax=Sesamum latifolium TaxID=2727402 RepID=A0AAW2V2E6_9LAMI
MKSELFKRSTEYSSVQLEMEEERQQQPLKKNSGSSIIVLHDALVVTMDSQNRVYRNGAVAVRGDTIVAVGQSEDIISQFSSLSPHLVNLHGQFLLPGLINTHVHTSQQLARGIADDVDLLTWLHDRIWPYESNMTEEESYISTLLCGIELIHSGVTCFAEAGGQHVSGMARAVERLGIRACLTQSVMDAGEGLPASWAKRTAEECIQSQKDLYKKHHNTADGRIRIWFGLRQIMNSTDRLLTETRDTAKELNTGIHMHVAEIPYENKHVVERRGVDHGTVTYLEKIKLLQSNLLAAHTVWVNEKEVGLLSKSRVKVSHCPAAAMHMLGFAPIREMIDAGVCVSLGTDGAPSNNRMSIETVLEMATRNGAKSVLWDKEIGSLEADMIVVNPYSWSMMPVHDSISSLVYCMRTENITSLMCNGRWIMVDKKILTVNEEEVMVMAKNASHDLLKRAGIRVPSRMNFL